MSTVQKRFSEDPRLQQAIAELSARIKAKNPATSFTVQQGVDDPLETWFVATVDIESGRGLGPRPDPR